MTRAEIFENRREVAKKICEHIRQNDGQMINAKNFLEHPHYDGEKKYKFSTANYLRLMSSENIYTDSRWYKLCDVEKNNWTLKANAKFELLEEWQDQECFLTKFYNASQIEGMEKIFSENKSLEEVLEFLQNLGLLKFDDEIISFKDGIDAVKNYAEKFVSDELTINFAVQMWTSESKLNTKMKKFLPTYSEEVLVEIEKNPDKIVTDFLKTLLNENRLQILQNLQTLKKYISPKIMVRIEELLHQANIESEIFQSAMENFEQE